MVWLVFSAGQGPAECAFVRLEAIRAGGPGGQHRNKVATGIRLTHKATGLVIEATEERSQLANRRLALWRLGSNSSGDFSQHAPRRSRPSGTRTKASSAAIRSTIQRPRLHRNTTMTELNESLDVTSTLCR